MPEFERTATVGATADEAFRFLADPGNLPKYIATMNTAELEGTNRLHVAADVADRHEEGMARFDADAVRRRIEWAGEGDSTYRGWLQVSESAGRASVSIHLHAERDDEVAEVDKALDETVSNIERLLASP